MSDLKGKVAVVTGASKGIGAAIARSLSRAGAAVVVNYTLARQRLDRVVAGIKANGGEAIAVKGDVTKVNDVRRLFTETKKAFDRLSYVHSRPGNVYLSPYSAANIGDANEILLPCLNHLGTNVAQFK